METEQGKIIRPNVFQSSHVVQPSKSVDNDGNGGENNMDDKYVTHTELELSNEKLLRHMDEQFSKLEKKMDANQSETNLKFERTNTKFESLNTKLEKQKVWFYGTAIGVVTATCTIVGFLIKFIK